MKTGKLVTGILSLILPVIILLQSCAAGLSNALEANGEVSGSAGFLVSILMIAGGIVMIATRSSTKKGGSIAATVIFAIAALNGYALAGSFADLRIWATWCLAMTVFNIIALIKLAKKNDVNDVNEDMEK